MAFYIIIIVINITNNVKIIWNLIKQFFNVFFLSSSDTEEEEVGANERDDWIRELLAKAVAEGKR